ncbi:hypothetical protein [Arthrobacter sulfonylureivorans]|uniref:Superoxide dismutase n=1 Tax=Arthrobacter sulfonylureivorans TaxID=2486855 RepID=A0ABY3W8Z3_9MICC|nr:hypothetical protein [Arthrobacter sulfonylureivorans]UNK46824.1 hypothetical protein MNQ99_05585 [Arthrobacter sulfonylureivorans]
MRHHSPLSLFAKLTAALLTSFALLLTGLPASAGPQVSDNHRSSSGRTDRIIDLPDATSAEGIAAGRGSTFYAGDLYAGDIFRGDLRRGTAEKFIDAPKGRFALGMAADTHRNLLFVAGGPTGKAYVYDTRTGKPVADFQLNDPAHSFINDVTLGRGGAWFTNSFDDELYFLPVGDHGQLGKPKALQLRGPAAELSGDFNLNGIVAADHGRKLIVAHTANGALYTVDPRTGASRKVSGVKVTNVDGLELKGRWLWAVQNTDNQISKIKLDHKLASGTVRSVINSDAFQTPTTAALIGNKLAVVNAKFDTGIPPTADSYEVVVVNPRR